MFHYFNVCDINGADVAPVDVTTWVNNFDGGLQKQA